MQMHRSAIVFTWWRASLFLALTFFVSFEVSLLFFNQLQISQLRHPLSLRHPPCRHRQRWTFDLFVLSLLQNRKKRTICKPK